MAISLLDREIYSYSDVDRIIGLHSGTAKRWLEGYSRDGRSYEPVLRAVETGKDAVTWGEMIETRFLSEFRSKRVPVQNMRPAITRLRQEFGRYPLAHSRALLDTHGRELVMKIQEEVGLEDSLQIVVVRNEQLLLSTAAKRFRRAIEFQNQEAAVFIPIERTPAVQLDPSRAFGQPAIRGVRTDVLAEAFRAGSDRDELADLFDLTIGQVDQAIRFEMITATGLAA